MQHQINELEAFYQKTEQQIRLSNPDPKGLAEPVIDGIISPEAYINAPLRIMWILKEPYCDFDEHGNPKGGGWHTRDLVSNFITRGHCGRSGTFRRIAYTSWGLLNNAESWNSIPDYPKDPGVLKTLESIAFINVKKIIGDVSANPEALQSAYDKDRNILLEQIEVANPQVIIFGYTGKYFAKDLSLYTKTGQRTSSAADYFFTRDRVYIDAYHPSYTQRKGLNDEAYCMDIISIVNEWRDQFHSLKVVE